MSEICKYSIERYVYIFEIIYYIWKGDCGYVLRGIWFIVEIYKYLLWILLDFVENG